jgi:multimeric flavodoxin WrbA
MGGIIMKVLLVNGSPRQHGCTYTALTEAANALHARGIETEIVWVGNKEIAGCTACGGCRNTGKCVFDDLVNETAPKLAEADGVVLGSPVYYATANATLMAFVTRLFYSTFNVSKTMKVGAAICSARRGGLSATYDEMNKFFGISGMPIASGQYWNSVHGAAPGQAAEDAEGMQGMRTLAKNMTFLMKSIALGKEQYGIPEKEPTIFTNFIR